jgi:hypothetical protein
VSKPSEEGKWLIVPVGRWLGWRHAALTAVVAGGRGGAEDEQPVSKRTRAAAIGTAVVFTEPCIAGPGLRL